MTELKPYADLLARVLLAVLFIIAGFGKLGDVQGFTGYMTSGGVPAFLAWPTILLELLGGIVILVGFQTRIVAFALAGFCLLSAVLFHLVPADQMQMTSFYKNLGLAGGYILLVIHGAGRFSADAYLAAKSATA